MLITPLILVVETWDNLQNVHKKVDLKYREITFPDF